MNGLQGVWGQEEGASAAKGEERMRVDPPLLDDKEGRVSAEETVGR